MIKVQIKISRLVHFGFMLFILMTATGICSADNVNVDVVSQFSGDILDVAVDGSYAYIGQGQDFVILDVTDITTISEVGRVTAPSEIYGITISGTHAYIADGDNGIIVIDISNPVSPAISGSYATGNSVLDVAVSGNYVYAADGNSLVIVDVTIPSSPTLAGTYDTIGFTNSVVISGNYAYVADDSKGIFDGSNGLAIVDISAPSSPTLAGTYADVYAYDAAVSGNYAYVADSSGLTILDISIPSSPTLAGTYSSDGDSNGVAVSGNYVYLADASGLVILDISNPSSLLYMGSYDGGYAYSVDVSDGNTFVAESSTGLVVVKLGSAPGTLISKDNSTENEDETDERPSISEIEDKSVNVNELLEFTVSATSPDGSEITYSVRGLPTGATLDSTTGVFSWVPDTAGDYVVTFDAESNGLADSETITIIVSGSDVSSEGSDISELSGKDISSNSITLTWSNSEDIDTVELYRNDVLIGNVTGSTSTYVDTGLASDTSYAYSLLPYYSNGTQGNAAKITLITSSSSSSSSGSDSSSSGGSSSGSSGSSSTKSSSGGGGGSGSAENFENIVMKDVSNEYLKINSNVTYEFSREGNDIQSINFYSLKNSGEITSSIEVLKNRSQFANSDPEGLVYKYINIWVGKSGFATESNIKDSRVKFKVNYSWIEEMGVNPEGIRLERYDGTSWEVLPTTLQNKTAGYVVFESRTPGFSSFAITGDKSLETSVNNSTDTKLKATGSENPSDVTHTESAGNAQTQQDKSNMLVPVMAVLGIVLLVAGYMYMRKS